MKKTLIIGLLFTSLLLLCGCQHIDELDTINRCDEITSPDETLVDLINCCDAKYEWRNDKVYCIRAVTSMRESKDITD